MTRLRKEKVAWHPAFAYICQSIRNTMATKSSYKQTEPTGMQAEEPVMAYRQTIPMYMQQRIASIEADIENGVDKGKSTETMWNELKTEFPWLTD